MSIFSRLLKPKPQTSAGSSRGPVNISSLPTIPVKCPTCGQVGDFNRDPSGHDFFGIFEIDKKTHLHNLECPYCKEGMMLCIRDEHLVCIEPYKDGSPADMLNAVERVRAKLRA